MAMAGSLLTFFGVFLAFRAGHAIEDYCSSNNYENSPGGGMHFTKEATNEEFAIAGQFKGLHCCAKGYKSIEWFKDGQAYPWDLDLSTLIIFPESANQTVYTQKIKEDDSGNYTCVLRNDRHNETEIHSHTINLKVFEKLPDDPKITYVSQDKEVVAGEPIRLFCEAFGGRIDLPDAHSEAEWHKLLPNGTTLEMNENRRVKQQKIFREEGQTFGTYLIFSEVNVDDFGTYVCVIKKPGNTINKKVSLREKVKVVEYINPNPFPLKELLIVSAIVILLLTTILILIKQYSLKVQVIIKDTYGHLEENDGKTNDILLAHAPKDSELAVGVMVPNLEARGYQCVVKELSPDSSSWSQELAHHVQSSRRLIVLLSPSALNDSWTPATIYQALKHLQTITTPKVICVTLKELPANQNETKNSQGETMVSLAKSMDVMVWQRSDNGGRFWLSLRKALPAKRATGTNREAPVEMTVPKQQSSRPRLVSERSFDSLMVV